jgi:hypothetical protein
MKLEAEPDRVERRFVVGVALVTLSITALACLVAWAVMRTAASQASLTGVHRIRAQLPHAPANDLATDLFADEQSASENQQKQASARLHSFGWSQPEHGLVHVPIDRAFELYLGGMRAPGAAAPSRGKP